ncbi:hypothetical protein [Bacillus luti]
MSLVQLRMASMCLEVGALPYIDTLGLHAAGWVHMMRAVLCV